MTTAELRGDARAVRVGWPDGSNTDFPYIWLRDNCPTGFHPDTREREFDLTSIPIGIVPKNVEVDDTTIRISWHEKEHISRFALDWLHDHRPGVSPTDAADIAPSLWKGAFPPSDLPRIGAETLSRDDIALCHFLKDTKQTGLAIVDGLPNDVEAGTEIAKRIGFLRETNFGVTFEVMTKPDPNNLAYTSHALPLHSDLANQELPPGFQFLHCLANEAEGGGSTFCDGFAIAADLRQSDPEAFHLLATVPIPFRFHDHEYDIRRHHTVIQLDHRGNVAELRFNAHLASIFDLPADQMETYYGAYRKLMQMSRSKDYVMTTRLEGGEMVIFDNRRVMHGRAAFDPSTGLRHLRGCYVDRGEFDSRIRVLSRK